MIKSIKNILIAILSFMLLAIYSPIHSIESSFFLRIDSICSEPKKIDLSAPILCDFINKQKAQNNEHVHNTTICTGSGLEIPVIFFDRNSDTVLLIGQGLPAPKEVMITYAKMFLDYDVILFDYRWHKNYVSFLLKSLALCSPIQRLLYDEEEEIRSVLDFLQGYKNYTKIIGLGTCYSNFLFTKIQADEIKKNGRGPFSHLILDSCWHSLKSFTESICDDPFLPISPVEGGAPLMLKKITSCPIVKRPLLKIIFTLMRDVSIEKYLSHLNIPVLFIYGLNDLFVKKDHFEALYQANETGNCAAFLTPYQHANNLHNKPLYHFMCEQFINSSSMTEFFDNCGDLYL